MRLIFTALLLIFCGLLGLHKVNAQKVGESERVENNNQFELFYREILKAKRQNDPRTSELYRKLLDKVPTVDSVELVANVYAEYSMYMSNLGEVDSALVYAYKAQELVYDLKKPFLEARIAHALGWYYHNIADFEKAIVKYKESLTLFKSIGFARGVRNTKKKLAITYDKKGAYKKALSIQEELTKEGKNGISLAEIATQIIRAFKANDTVQVRTMMDVYFSKIVNPEDHAKVNNTWHEIKAIDYEYKGDFDIALFHFYSARRIIEKEGRLKALSNLDADIGDFFFRHSRFDDAATFYEKGFRLIDENRLDAAFEYVVNQLIECYKQLGDNSKVEYFTNQSLSFKSQLNSKKSHANILEQSHQVKLREKETEIGLLRKVRDSQQRFVFLLSIFSVVALGLMLAAFFYFRKYKKLSTALSHKNQALDQSNAEKQTLLQETHHRVKNNLQIIASLLNLQRKYTKDKKLNTALVDGKNRVKSMAIIHQMLYQNEVIKGINVRTYVEHLMSSLLGSFKIENERIHFVNDVAPIDLHEDSLLSIGLIINELVTNALKYAFDDSQFGEIHVSLQQEGNDLRLLVRDNGCGLQKGTDESMDSSFGYNLIKSLSKKLGANVVVTNNNGTEVSMLIKKYKLAE